MKDGFKKYFEKIKPQHKLHNSKLLEILKTNRSYKIAIVQIIPEQFEMVSKNRTVNS